MTRTNTKGFAVIETLVVFVIVLVIAGVGWYVWKGRQSTDKTADSSANAQSSEVSKKEAPKASFAHGLVYDTYFSQLPDTLQKSIVAFTAKEAKECVKNGKLLDSDGKLNDRQAKYMSDGFAQISIGCKDTSSALFVLDGVEWKEVDSTTYMYQCHILEQYKMPLKFMEAVDSRRPVKCVEYPYDNPSTVGKEVIYKG